MHVLVLRWRGALGWMHRRRRLLGASRSKLPANGMPCPGPSCLQMVCHAPGPSCLQKQLLPAATNLHPPLQSLPCVKCGLTILGNPVGSSSVISSDIVGHRPFRGCWQVTRLSPKRLKNPTRVMVSWPWLSSLSALAQTHANAIFLLDS